MDNSSTTTVKIYSYTIPSGSYDDDTTKTLTGSSIVSGLVFPVSSLNASQHPILQQQGKILEKDKVCYIGSVNMSGNVIFVVNGDNYVIMPNGIHTYEINGSHIFSEVFLRITANGSLF